LMVKRVHAIRIEIEPGLDVPDESVLGETVPKTGHDIIKLASATVALVVIKVILPAKVESRVRVRRRHDVPARAASAEMVERSEAARDVIGLVKRRGRRRNQADALGDHREGG